LILKPPQKCIHEVLTTEYTLAAVEEYVPCLWPGKKRLPSDILLLALAALPDNSCQAGLNTSEEYRLKATEAHRTPRSDDVDLLELLALHSRILKSPFGQMIKTLMDSTLNCSLLSVLLRHIRMIE
jgi:hypothetical protein